MNPLLLASLIHAVKMLNVSKRIMLVLADVFKIIKVILTKAVDQSVFSALTVRLIRRVSETNVKIHALAFVEVKQYVQFNYMFRHVTALQAILVIPSVIVF